MRKYDLHAAMMQLAKDSIRDAIYEEEGEKLFILGRFIDTLSNRIETFIGSGDPIRGFALDPVQIARHIYCCLALENGDDPAGLKFHGMYVAD